MDEIYREMLYYEIGKYVAGTLKDIDFSALPEKRAMKALSEIQKIINDDKFDEDIMVAYIEDILVEYGIEASGNYE